MFQPEKNPFYFFLLIGFLVLTLSSCLHSSSDSGSFPGYSGSDPQIETIYIQSFTGASQEKVRDIFYKAIKLQKTFKTVEILPDDFTALGVLRVKVNDYSIWENDGKLENMSKEKPEVIKRRNALISISVSLFDANTGAPLVNMTFSQPFQQIYVTENDLKNLPTKEMELERLTRIVIYKVLESFQSLQLSDEIYEYEEGKDYGWIAENIVDFGNRRIKKGIQFAKSKNYNKAIWIWKIILFEPEEGEPDNIYLFNRATAYYNLGVVYNNKHDWLKAAFMFSKANRLERKLKYAQAWGDNMQIWLKEQKKPKIMKKRETESSKKLREITDAKERENQRKKPNIIRELEKNDALLLKAANLWPLEPLTKTIDYRKLDEGQSKEEINNVEEDLASPSDDGDELKQENDEIEPSIEEHKEIPLEPVDLTE